MVQSNKKHEEKQENICSDENRRIRFEEESAGVLFQMPKSRFAILVVIIFLAGSVAGIGTSFFTGIGGQAGAGNRVLFSPMTQGGEGAATSASGLNLAYSKIATLEGYLKENYYRSITDGAIETGLLRGLFASPADPYTMYYTKEEFDLTMEKTHGELSGVGLTLMENKSGVIEVISVVEDSPADKAGLKSGDLLLSVDGKNYSGAELMDAVDAARGEPGTKVVLGISREGKTIRVEITRAVFVSPTVEHEMLTGKGAGIGYIKVTSFNDNTATDFKAALESMNKGGAKGIVIDLRNNAGGLVDMAVEMDDMLLDRGVICYAEDGKDKRITYEATDGRVTSLPYALVIDGTSVSAAEIFALGVKANGGGKLVGQTTFGKGLIQKLERFESGDGARITIMQYVTPDGNPVNGIGIAPDITVEQPKDAKQGTADDAPLWAAVNQLVD